MPKNDLQTFTDYVSKNKIQEFDVEKTISQTIENTEKFKFKNSRLTLLACHFFHEERSNICASYMFLGDIVPPHNHDYYEINYVVSGKCVEYIADRVFILEEGDFLLMPPCVTHSPAPVGNSRCANMLFRAEWIGDFEKKILTYNLDSFLTRMQRQNSYMVFNAKDTAAFFTAEQITQYFENKSGYLQHHELYAHSLAEKFLLELAECPFNETLYVSRKLPITANFYEYLLQYIIDNISSISLESTSYHFGYSPVHISRIIKKHTGYSFKTFLMLQRILCAEEYLIKTDIPISRIASLIGLDSKEYFSRVFKKYNNITPSEYRRLNTVKRPEAK